MVALLLLTEQHSAENNNYEYSSHTQAHKQPHSTLVSDYFRREKKMVVWFAANFIRIGDFSTSTAAASTIFMPLFLV